MRKQKTWTQELATSGQQPAASNQLPFYKVLIEI